MEQHPEPPQPIPGVTIASTHETVTLVAPVHSPMLSQRWSAIGQQSNDPYEVLFLTDATQGPLLSDAASWGAERAQWEGGTALVFPIRGLKPLAELIPWPAPDPDVDRERWRHDQRTWRFQLVLALGELFEIIHVVCDALIAHADLDMYAIRIHPSLEATLMRPELLHTQANPPRSGSFQGSGLDAPEITGLISRPIDTRADVYMLGMLTYALLTGITPTSGTERFTERLPPPRAFDTELPLGIDLCIRRAIARTPEQRYISAFDFIQHLRAAWAQAPAQLANSADRRVAIGWAAHSEIGRAKLERYPVNQDSHFVTFDPQTSWGLFAVMDGVSKSDVGLGEFASWLARSTLEREWNLKRRTPIYGRTFPGHTPFPCNLMEKLALQAHQSVIDWLELLLGANPAPPPGNTLCTTLAAVGLFGDRCALCNVGDSPIFLIRLGNPEPVFEQLTVEHNQVLWHLRRGVPIPEALDDPGGGQLTSALGLTKWPKDTERPTPIEPEITSWSLRLHPGDLLLICSDGVPDAFGTEAPNLISRLLNETLGDGDVDHARLSVAVRNLVQTADRRGGHDNLTAILVSVGRYLD